MKFNEKKAKQYLIDLINKSELTPKSFTTEVSFERGSEYVNIQLFGISGFTFKIDINGSGVINDFGKAVFNEKT